MNGADWLIFATVVISCAIGAVRGFMREAVALVTWLLGLWLAWTFADEISPHLGGLLAQPAVRVWVARLIILALVLLLGTVAGMVLAYFVRHSPFGFADRVLGLFFGLLRGGVLVGVAVIVGQLVELNHEKWWDESRFLPYAQYLADWIRQLVDDVDLAAIEWRTWSA
jgi:membrane protein required for colicin V production